ncbi:MAG: response regulator [Lachnospiraceae bacterium]
MKEDTILIIDDGEINREILKSALKDTYDIVEASDGEEGLQIIESRMNELSLIILDIKMPVMDGFQFLEELSKKKRAKYIPVLMITADTTTQSQEIGYSYGIAAYITKPFNIQIVIDIVHNVILSFQEKRSLELITVEQNKRLKEQADRLEKLNSNILDMLGTIIEFRGIEGNYHIRRIKEFTRLLATCVTEYYPEYELDKRDIELIAAASCMHDIGKTVIPDSILLKPGHLTVEELEVMKSHTTKGCEIIDAVSQYQEKAYYTLSYEICRYHHERYDGKGYPEGLKRDEIPISAQIVSVAEAFDALISNTVYRKNFSLKEAMRMIEEGDCGIFSPKIIECFRMSKTAIREIAEKYEEHVNE